MEEPKRVFKLTKKELSWILYDVGNSAFYTTVMAGFFPVFFKEFWHHGSASTTSSFHLGLTNSIAALVVALMAPIVGIYADHLKIKRPLLVTFSLLGIIATAALSFIGKGDYQLAMWAFAIAMVGVSTSTSVYDSQITDVTDSKNYHKISAIGYSAGYLGGGILFTVNVLMTLKPELFGIADAAQAVKLSFLTVSLWWTVFALPSFLFIGDQKHPNSKKQYSAGLKQLIHTFKSIFANKPLVTFLVAYWLYIDGVGTIMKMAVDYGLSLGFGSSDLITALLVVQFVGFPAAIAFGIIGDKIGAKKGIYIGIGIYSLTTIFAYFMTSKIEFYMLAVSIGLVQGGVQSLSRSLFAHLIPSTQSAEYFGIYNMLGKFAAVLGPIIMGGVALLTESTRLSMLSVLVLFAAGGFLLTKVKIEE